MTDKIRNNQATIIGTVEEELVYSHEMLGESFYTTHVSVERLSGVTDSIPVTISERLIDVKQSLKGKPIQINGDFRSYNDHSEGKNHLILSLFALECFFLESIERNQITNQITLDGYVCKEIICRETPLGRKIADLLIAVNRSYGKSDYIPCICWGRNAEFANDKLELGTHLTIKGRIQSREYTKKIDENNFESRMAYEVSILNYEVIADEEKNY